MTFEKSDNYLHGLLKELRGLPKETEWVEFKVNKVVPNDIGEYISALANSAALHGKVCAYLVWGIDNKTHDAVGTSFRPSEYKKGNEELENWLLRLLSPKIDFMFYEIEESGNPIAILEISRATHKPVQFQGVEYIRIGSCKKKLKEFQEKERTLWRIFDKTPFEELIAKENVPEENVLKLLDYPAYFDLLNINLPENRVGILGYLEQDDIIKKNQAGGWDVTNLGAILFAKQLNNFTRLERKAVRVIIYKSNNRLETIREQDGVRGYATGFQGLIDFILSILPSNEIIGKAIRKDVAMFPELAIRELVANAIIHQDFFMRGTEIKIEIFSDRMEISNPGKPLVKTERFLDNPPKSRNEKLASFMRRIGICEERGSGIDKVVFQAEIFQLPAPMFELIDDHTKATLFAHKTFSEMDKSDRLRACYLHSCLKYVQKEYMTNSSLRERFNISKENYSMISRIIRDSIEAGLIKVYDPSNASKKHAKYVPFWA